METILFFLVTFVASVAGAISGIGGGIIIKPLLELVAHERIEVIAFASGCTVLSMAAVSLLRRAGQIRNGFELRRGTLLAMGSVLGGVFGKMLFDGVKRGMGTNGTGLIQSAVLALMALLLIVYMRSESRVHPRNVRGSAACTLLGAGLGMLGSFLGIGGGPLNLVVLTYFLGMDNKRAALHSIYIILFAQVANLLMTFLQNSVPEMPTALLVSSILGGVLGALLGSSLVPRMTNRAIGRLYSAILLFVLILAVVNLLGHIGNH